jgi:hypothetical protein
LLRFVVQKINSLSACLRPNALYTRQSFEHALDALLAALSSNALISDHFQSDRFQHEIASAPTLAPVRKLPVKVVRHVRPF